NSKEQFKRYFDGLLADWEMINYKTGQFIAEGERVAMLGSTAWRNRRTGREVDTPKADFWTFEGGKVVEFHELYDTAGLAAAAQPETRELIPGAAGIIEPHHAQRDAEHVVVPVPANRPFLASAGTRIHLGRRPTGPFRLAVGLCVLLRRTPRE